MTATNSTWRRCSLPILGLILLGCASQTTQTDPVREPSRAEMTGLRYQMAEALVQKRDYEAAAPFIRDLLIQHPESARLHLLLGIVLREKGVYKAAEQEIRKSLELNPNSPDGYEALGVLQIKLRHYKEAEKSHRKAVSMAPKVARYHNDLGFSLLVQRRYDEAQTELGEAVRLDPSMRRAYNNLGFALGLSDKMEAAMTAFSQAGSREMALTNMGYVYELTGQPQAARRYYERALKVRRGYPPALHNLRRVDPSRRMDDVSTHVEHVEEVRNEQYRNSDEIESGSPAKVGPSGPSSGAVPGSGGSGGAAGGMPQGEAPRRQHGQELR